jgi:hypothetical protein
MAFLKNYNKIFLTILFNTFLSTTIAQKASGEIMLYNKKEVPHGTSFGQVN